MKLRSLWRWPGVVVTLLGLGVVTPVAGSQEVSRSGVDPAHRVSVNGHSSQQMPAELAACLGALDAVASECGTARQRSRLAPDRARALADAVDLAVTRLAAAWPGVAEGPVSAGLADLVHGADGLRSPSKRVRDAGAIVVVAGVRRLSGLPPIAPVRSRGLRGTEVT